MTRQEKKALESLKIDPFNNFLAAQFRRFPDARASNQSITAKDALMSGYAVFSLKYPSLLQYDGDRAAVEDNLRTIYKVDKAPSDTALRAILDEMPVEEMGGVFKEAAKKMRQAGIFRSYAYLDGHIVASMDGVHFYSSEKVCCGQCLEYRKKNGKAEYRHSLLSAVVVHPDKQVVLPIAHEPIAKQDGREKNDCERNAASRLLPQLRQALPVEKVIVAEDALGANAPHIRELRKHGFRFVIGVKPDGHKHLFKQSVELAGRGACYEHRQEDERYIHEFRYANSLELNAENPDLKVNFLEYRQTDKEGKKPERRFSWITDFQLNKRSVYKIMRIGRSRWKIENETFNTLKNQGYNFGHNYGHGKKNLCAMLALLMMLAFLADQLQQGWDEMFQAAWQRCKSKAVLWQKMRQKFDEYAVPSMETIYAMIIGKLKVRYQIIEWSG